MLQLGNQARRSLKPLFICTSCQNHIIASLVTITDPNAARQYATKAAEATKAAGAAKSAKAAEAAEATKAAKAAKAARIAKAAEAFEAAKAAKAAKAARAAEAVEAAKAAKAARIAKAAEAVEAAKAAKAAKTAKSPKKAKSKSITKTSLEKARTKLLRDTLTVLERIRASSTSSPKPVDAQEQQDGTSNTPEDLEAGGGKDDQGEGAVTAQSGEELLKNALKLLENVLSLESQRTQLQDEGREKRDSGQGGAAPSPRRRKVSLGNEDQEGGDPDGSSLEGGDSSSGPRMTGSSRISASGPYQSFNPDAFDTVPIPVSTPRVPHLEHRLDRVLFNPGVYQLQDPRTRLYNFDPYLARIMPIEEFDFDALKKYVTSSKDTTLLALTAEHNKKYTGSTSSMTATLAHFHFLLSAWRPPSLGVLSHQFVSKYVKSHDFNVITRAPVGAFLHWKDGTYAIDADKEFDTPNILSLMGRSMEKLLSLPKHEFEKYRRTKSHQLDDSQRNAPEAYHYTTMGDFLLRSQLDAHDPRMPGTGMFDLKTRAVISIRMDAADHKKGLGYEIRNRFGEFESYEREYYDLIRSAFLKYSLQVRMGRMDGIFVAYHNVERIFGFQYIPLSEMDAAIHGTWNTTLGDREYKASLRLLNIMLDKATERFPKQSLRLFFEMRGDHLQMFAKPVSDKEIADVQDQAHARAEKFERAMTSAVTGEARKSVGDEAEITLDDIDVDEAPNNTNEAAGLDASLGKNEIDEVSNHTSEAVDLDASRGKNENDEAPDHTGEVAGLESSETVSGEQPDDTEELLALRLTIQNRVNGEVVDRPGRMLKSDEWIVDYAIAPLKPSTVKKEYDNLRKRREKHLAASDMKTIWYMLYGGQLAKYSKAGQQRRLKETLESKDRPVKILGVRKWFDYSSVFHGEVGRPAGRYRLWRRRRRTASGFRRLALPAQGSAPEDDVPSKQE